MCFFRICYNIKRRNRRMRINKLCHPQKLKLVLSSTIEHYQNNQLSRNSLISVGISRTKLQKRCSIGQRDKQNTNTLCQQQSDSLKHSQQKSKQNLRLGNNSGEQKYNFNKSSKSQSQTTKQKIKSNPIKNRTFTSLISDLIDLLKSKFIIQQNHISTLTIKKDYLYILISILLKIQNETDRSATFNHIYGCIEGKMTEIRQIINYDYFERKSQKNKIKNCVITHFYDGASFVGEISSLKNDLKMVTSQKMQIIQQVQKLNDIKESIARQYNLKQNEISQQLNAINSNNIHIQHLKEKINITHNELKHLQASLQKNKKYSDKIYNYIHDQDQNKLIKLASEEYKSIESDIYQYAAYLQCNQLASSLVYQPLSITCLTQDIQNQIKNVNKTIVQRQDLTVKDKVKIMRDFLLQWMDRFRKKDDQQKQLMNFKTKCVMTFIQKMKKWLDNWTFKQEYLVNLRAQFAVNSSKMKEVVSQLGHLSICQKCKNSINSVKQQLAQLYQKIEQNYKLGNSFY